MFVPIFEKERNRFFLLHEDFVSEDESEARKIGLGSSLVEGILMGAQFKDVVQINPKNIPNRKGNILGYSIAIISGPLFEEVIK